MAKIDRRERAVRRMAAIPDAVKRRAKAQQEANAADMVALVKSRAPVAEVDGGELKASVRHYDASDETGIRQRVVEGDRTTVRTSANGRPYAYPRGVEFGTSEMQAQPHFWPSYRQRRASYRRKMNKAAKDGIAEALASS